MEYDFLLKPVFGENNIKVIKYVGQHKNMV